jgi:hypothetical protein
MQSSRANTLESSREDSGVLDFEDCIPPKPQLHYRLTK